jgi:hypothetical protein
VKVEEQARGRRLAGAAAAVLEPAAESVLMHGLIEEERRELFLEIHERKEGRRLVTCIELLSPSNKRRGSDGWKEYQRKRDACFQGLPFRRD